MIVVQFYTLSYMRGNCSQANQFFFYLRRRIFNGNNVPDWTKSFKKVCTQSAERVCRPYIHQIFWFEIFCNGTYGVSKRYKTVSFILSFRIVRCVLTNGKIECWAHNLLNFAIFYGNSVNKNKCFINYTSLKIIFIQHLNFLPFYLLNVASQQYH